MTILNPTANQSQGKKKLMYTTRNKKTKHPKAHNFNYTSDIICISNHLMLIV